ncbi:putative ABC transport system ATP-binding protein [Klenkia soli]|uniref:Putative ABC transport system ATP-binding protein n=1 Tax=Klenkia soli TaxID=1052260 RepID=A0A1H0RXY3_9ACTN|nr:ATP-binding cassette domain-containing protein [Klenkia soli]SDP33788.1 putative ABC transport system ATP-binding protein [Klenkia soli]
MTRTPSSRPDEPAVVLSGVGYSYGRTPALEDASLTVAAGEVVAVTGPSGCGKSTLLMLAAGVLRAQAGRVQLAGQDLGSLGEADRARLRRREVGLVLQYGQLVPDLGVVDNIALPLLLEGRPPGDARRAATSWLERVGLELTGDERPGELSGGQAQQVAAARALVASPRLLLADEPTASLDPRAGRELLDLMVTTTRSSGGSVVLVSHDNTVAARADREVRLRAGRVAHEVGLA